MISVIYLLRILFTIQSQKITCVKVQISKEILSNFTIIIIENEIKEILNFVYTINTFDTKKCKINLDNKIFFSCIYF